MENIKKKCNYINAVQYFPSDVPYMYLELSICHDELFCGPLLPPCQGMVQSYAQWYQDKQRKYHIIRPVIHLYHWSRLNILKCLPINDPWAVMLYLVN